MWTLFNYPERCNDSQYASQSRMFGVIWHEFFIHIV